MRRLRDQVEILNAISNVRKELRDDLSRIEMAEILTRLTTLYALLDADGLAKAAKVADARDKLRRIA